jgi:hypothetical protein
MNPSNTNPVTRGKLFYVSTALINDADHLMTGYYG